MACCNPAGGGSVKIYYEEYARDATDAGMGSRTGVVASGFTVRRRNVFRVRMLEAVSRSARWRVAASIPTQVQSAATDSARATRPCLVMANIRTLIAGSDAHGLPVVWLLKLKAFEG